MLLHIQEPGTLDSSEISSKDIAIGIDFGTTYSLAAIAYEDSIQIFQSDEGKKLLPSLVYYDADGCITEDKEATAYTIRSIKRLIGKSLTEAQSLEYVGFPYDLSLTEGMVHLKIGKRSLSPVEIAVEIFKKVKYQAEKALEQSIHKAVVTVPAYFDETARAATRDAAKIAGLDVLRLVNEPTAAALAYGLEQGAEGIYAIYDLGGGTFDISLLNLTKGVFQVLATGGISTLGGDDFDSLLADFLAKQKGEGLTPSLLLEARQVKESLSEDETSILGSLRVTRSTLDMLIHPLVDQTIAVMRSVLKDAAITPPNLKGIVLVGGSTRIPLISELLKKSFNIPILNTLNPDEVVARGAALQAKALTQGSGTLLLDVVPLSLGLETMGGIVEKIIPRNTPIPISKAQDFTTYQDGQSAMKIHILQGERELVEDCRSLAYFNLTEIPPLPAGQARIRVTFTVDADGLLTVTAQEKTTGQSQRVEVNPAYGLSPERIAHLLRESLEKGSEDMEIRLLRQTHLTAERLIKSVTEALQKDGDLLDSNSRDSIEELLSQLISLNKSDDRKVLSEMCKKLEQQTQKFAEKRMERSIQDALKGKEIKTLSRKGRQRS